MLSYLTVEETLTYTAQLALRKHSVEEIKKKVTLKPLLVLRHILTFRVGPNWVEFFWCILDCNGVWGV